MVVEVKARGSGIVWPTSRTRNAEIGGQGRSEPTISRLTGYSSARRIDEFLVKLGDTGFVGVTVVDDYPQSEL